ncbi:MAG: PAS domain-containing sensor histidine kinase [Gemmatimonadota bacterium]
MPRLSFRARILLVVLVVGVVPLAMLGLWLTRTAPRSGERLLRSRLNQTLDQAVSQVASRWVVHRSEILFLTEDRELHGALRALQGSDSGESEPDPPPGLRRRFEALEPGVLAISVHDERGEQVWALGRSPEGVRRASVGELLPPGVVVDLGIHDVPSGERLGTLRTVLDPQALVTPSQVPPAAAGMVLAAFEPSTGASLLPLPLEPTLLSDATFVWEGERWMGSSRTLAEPPVTLAVAAPLTPFIAPFEEVARRGTWLLLVLAVGGLALVAALTGRMTRSLSRLSEAAEAISQGDLERRISPEGDDEVGRVARAFNTMVESLRRTLAELANRESLAAVGEFAASLAHEVRNPLTAIRVDLQHVEEELPGGSPLREPQERALRAITRLDETVSSALTVARSGRIRSQRIDLREPIRAAAAAAQPAFEARAASLDVSCGPDPIHVSGDGGALEQLFLNLLQNAAAALDEGGEATVEVSFEDAAAVVTVRDGGCGMPAEVLERIYEPFYSTRAQGTGLGLPIARRIASAHGGSLSIHSEPGRGTTAAVRLPRERPPSEP